MIDQRKITLNEGEELAKKSNALFIETSCKMNINVNELFNKLVGDILIKDQSYLDGDKSGFKIKDKKKLKKKCC